MSNYAREKSSIHYDKDKQPCRRKLEVCCPPRTVYCGAASELINVQIQDGILSKKFKCTDDRCGHVFWINEDVL